MQRAIDAARAVRGYTSPNPWVGAVLVRDGRVISIGATAPFGGPHAEAAALANVDARGADLYTTLEPCMPFEGKRTPPCSEAVLAAGIRRVVIALEDPHAPVAGQGAAFLRGHGIAVELGDGAEAVRDLLRPYLRWRSTGRPNAIAKFAVSLDGKVGAPAAGIRWLTGEAALARAHEDRAWVDAIMVGSGTVLADDPALTARNHGQLAPRQPVRVVLDGSGAVRPSAKVLGAGAIVATASRDVAWRDSIARTGATLLEIEDSAGGLNLVQLLRALGQRNIMSLLVEGGPTLLQSLFQEDLVDEVHAYIAPLVLGSAGLPLFPGGATFEPATLQGVVVEELHPDVLIRGYTGAWSPEVARR